MHKNIYNTRKRYNERKRKRASALSKVLVLAALTFFCGIWLGKQYSLSRVEGLNSRVDSQTEDLTKMQESLLEARTEAQTANSRFLQLKEEISRELPNEGPLRDIVAHIRKRLEEGMDPERLLFLIQSARPPRNCIDAQTKRIVVSTPDNTGPDSSINIDNGTVTVSGDGASAKNEQGQAESWFDAAKPVVINFTTNAGLEEKKEGVFPLYHSLVVGDKEYRFTIDEGTRSFAKITYDHCDYP
tara:strand:- start:602 stop:1330 length:729 start_codon:yes stop_codon:yes gene_type:complete